jgi:hypothetical protein
VCYRRHTSDSGAISEWYLFVLQCLRHELFFKIGMGGGWSPIGSIRYGGLLCQPRVIMKMEKLMEWLAGETEVLGGNLPQCRFVHHQTHLLPGRNPGRRSGKPAITAWATARPSTRPCSFCQQKCTQGTDRTWIYIYIYILWRVSVAPLINVGPWSLTSIYWITTYPCNSLSYH